MATITKGSCTSDNEQDYSRVIAREKLEFNKAIYAWCLQNTESCINRDAVEEALLWCELTARILSLQCSPLSSPELEEHLTNIGDHLAIPDLAWVSSQSDRKRWVHVVTEVSSEGGHSAMLRRWLRLDPQPNRHSLVLLNQRKPIPDAIVESISSRGGDILPLDPFISLGSKAIRLREYTWKEADVVVLHVHPWDVIPTVAFSAPGGPPVMLVNHAAHIFWVGGSVADMVLNCRGSKLENDWTVHHRGVGRSMFLPIPLPESDRQSCEPDLCSDARKSARTSLNIPEDAVVLLSVGLEDKYTPIPGISFFDAVGSVLQSCRKAYLITVGPKVDSHWKALQASVRGRLIMVENQPDISQYYAAADLYLEGFPFGSTTALLEAGLQGIPCVLAPEICPPPFTTDGVALDGLSKASDMNAYIDQIVILIEDERERRRQGALLAERIKAHHCGVGWVKHLEAVQKNLPSAHKVYSLQNLHPVQKDVANYWAERSVVLDMDPLNLVFTYHGLPLDTRIDKDLLKLILAGKIGCARDQLPNILDELADYCYWHDDFQNARRLYWRAALFGAPWARILMKYTRLLMGRPGMKAREIISALKSRVEERLR